MRAARIHQLGSLPVVDDVAAPAAEGGRELLRVRAVALNPLDLNIGAGRFYGGHPPLPYVPGSEAVAERASGGRCYLFGDGLGVQRDGTLAELLTVDPGRIVPLPDDVEDALAVALGIAGIAGWTAVHRARTGPGDRVLVLGASGASATVALQAAKALGADVVVAAGRDLARLRHLYDLGADAIVTYDDDLKDACGGDGPTVIIDPLWDGPLATAVEAAAPGARIAHYGQSAGPETTLTSAAVRGKELELHGVSNFRRTPDELASSYLALLEQSAAGRIRLDVETFALDAVDEAWRRQQAGAKAVVTL